MRWITPLRLLEWQPNRSTPPSLREVSRHVSSSLLFYFYFYFYFYLLFSLGPSILRWPRFVPNSRGCLATAPTREHPRNGGREHKMNTCGTGMLKYRRDGFLTLRCAFPHRLDATRSLGWSPYLFLCSMFWLSINRVSLLQQSHRIGQSDTLWNSDVACKLSSCYQRPAFLD